MYKGEVSIAQDSLSSFLHVAEMLQVRGLSESQDLIPSITEKNIITPVTTQTESLFISVPEGNKILFTTPAIATQQVPELIKTPLKQQQQPQQQQQQSQTQQLHVQVQQKKNDFLDQSGIAAKRKKSNLKENRNVRTSNSGNQFVTENIETFNKQDSMIVDESGKESVYGEYSWDFLFDSLSTLCNSLSTLFNSLFTLFNSNYSLKFSRGSWIPDHEKWNARVHCAHGSRIIGTK